MSYILDALRRADAERERGTVPGIHAQQVPGASPPPGDAPSPWPWAAGGAGLLLLGGLAWLWVAPDAPAPAVDAAVATWTPPQEPATQPAPVPAPAPAAAPPVAPPVVSLPPIESRHTLAGPPAARFAATKLVAAPVAAASSAHAASAADAPVPSLQDLPEALRQQIPTLTIGGSIYSDDPANRFLIINGQVVHEGHPVAPGLVLEQIRLKAAVLRFKGQRFGVSY